MGRPVSVGVLAAVACGCAVLLHTAAATSGTYPRLLHSASVERVELLTAEGRLAETWLEYEADVGLPEDMLRAEQVMGDRDTIRSVKSGGGYHLVVAQRVGQGGPPQGIWVFDAEWQARGEVMGLPADQPGTTYYTISLHLDGTGTRWAAVVAQWGEERCATDVGLISPGRLRFEGKLHCDRCSHVALAWRGDHIVVSPSLGVESSNFILDFDPASGASTVLYEEDVRGSGRAPFGAITVSPTGRHIAFGRAPYRPGREYGLWLLDRETGECEKILYDETGLLDCVPIRWSGPDTLILKHTIGRGQSVRHQWYRATLRLPK